MTKQEKLLDKLAKIQNHMTSAKKIGNENEAECFATMLQSLCLKHQIALTDIQLQDVEKDDPIKRHRMDYEKGQVERKHRRIQWQEQLASLVAHAHFCRILVSSGNNQITMVGRTGDAAIAEYVFMTLTRAIEKIAYKEQDKHYYMCKNEDRLEDAKGFKAAFINSFVNRIGQRFDEQKEEVKTESSTALVRVNTADKAIELYMDAQIFRSASSLGGHGSTNMDGHRAGRNAANNINLGQKGIKQSSTTTRQLKGGK
tara:strand:+ start:4855 stop:5625 length:771 start_codon:yes stop_codon:yes gene_type:complete